MFEVYSKKKERSPQDITVYPRDNLIVTGWWLLINEPVKTLILINKHLWNRIQKSKKEIRPPMPYVFKLIYFLKSGLTPQPDDFEAEVFCYKTHYTTQCKKHSTQCCTSALQIPIFASENILDM